MQAAAVVLTVPDGQGSGVVDNDAYLPRKKKVLFRGLIELVDSDASPASCLVEWESCEDDNWIYRPSASETAGAHYH